METRQFGTTDMRVGVLGFGGAEIGYNRARPEVVARLLGDALDHGLNVIDTAASYLRSEVLIGQAVASRRSEFYLFTKCGVPEFPSAEAWKPMAVLRSIRRELCWRPESLLLSIRRSLQRLKTDRFDLVQLHSCTEETLRKGDVVAVLQRAREKGYTRYIGYSGDGPAARYSIECGVFDALQTSLSIADQEAIDLTLPLARSRQMGVIAKRPIANAAWLHSQTPDHPYTKPYRNRLQKLRYEFLKGDLAEGVATALRFTLSVPGVHTAIVGTSNPDRWRQNAAMLEAGLIDPKQFEEIRTRWRQAAEQSWVGQM
jgi:aryl-alcohol dehydrogenase-like predicted oxidoreductase